MDHPDGDEESFSLSSFDFTSSFGLYSTSDDEEEGGEDYATVENKLQDRNIHEAYIELELRSAADHEDIGDTTRFSFSAAVVPSFPGFQPAANYVYMNNNVSSCCSITAQDSDPQLPSKLPRRPITSSSSTLPAISISQVAADYGHCHINTWENIVRSTGRQDALKSGKGITRIMKPQRKVSSEINSTGGIMKLVVKLRSIIGSMRLSSCTPNSQQMRITVMNKLKFDMNWFNRRKLKDHHQQTTSSVRTDYHFLKFNAMMKKLLIISPSTIFPNTYKGKISRLNKTSCSTNSTKSSSPVHHQGDTSLVHAAIAHCKKSLGQEDEFSF